MVDAVPKPFPAADREDRVPAHVARRSRMLRYATALSDFHEAGGKRGAVTEAHDEQSLIDGARRGDREAQREIYSRTADRIYRLLLRMTRNPDDAFDLAQETYLRAFTRISQFDGRSAFATWLYGIAVNEGRQFLRRSTKRRTQELEPPLDPSDAASNDDRAHVRVDVEDALAALAPDDRAILLLRYQEGLDYATIAEIAGCPPGTVASRLNRARQRLRERLWDAYGCMEEIADGDHPISGSTPRGAEVHEPGSLRAKQPGTGSR